MGHRAGERAVRTHRSCPAVGGDTHKAIPVFEIPQLRAVDLVNRLTVFPDAVAAAPEPVTRLHHKVHFRHLPQNLHFSLGSQLGQLTPDQPVHQKEVISLIPDHMSAVQRRHPDTGEGHPVILAEGFSDTGSGDLHPCILHRHPAYRFGILKISAGAGIQPEIPVFGVCRLCSGYRRPRHALPGRSTGLKDHIAVRSKFPVDGSEIRQIQGVDPLSVRQDDHIRPHGHQLLRRIRQTKLHRVAVHHEPAALGVAKAVLGDDSRHRPAGVQNASSPSGT